MFWVPGEETRVLCSICMYVCMYVYTKNWQILCPDLKLETVLTCLLYCQFPCRPGQSYQISELSFVEKKSVVPGFSEKKKFLHARFLISPLPTLSIISPRPAQAQTQSMSCGHRPKPEGISSSPVTGLSVQMSVLLLKAGMVFGVAASPAPGLVFGEASSTAPGLNHSGLSIIEGRVASYSIPSTDFSSKKPSRVFPRQPITTKGAGRAGFGLNWILVALDNYCLPATNI